MKRYFKKVIIPSFKDFITHINFDRFKPIITISFLALIIVIVIFLTPTTYSKYKTETDSTAEPEIAFYLLQTDYRTTNILLEEIAPRNAPYTHKFTVSNNNGTSRTETNLQYDLSIRTTTNLPLTYELYLNSEYTDQNAQNIITDEQVIQDDDGTYFNKFTTDTEYFSHAYNETNEYQLVVYFPSNYINEMYQDIIDSIEITVDSKQVISNQ